MKSFDFIDHSYITLAIHLKDERFIFVQGVNAKKVVDLLDCTQTVWHLHRCFPVVPILMKRAECA